MKHPSYDETCGVCRAIASVEPIFENDLWFVARMQKGIGIPGWVMVCAQRHTPGIAYLDDVEAKNFGPAMRHFARTLEEVTGALRIYTAALGESFPHLHAHLVPRYAKMPNDARAWGVFDLHRATEVGEVTVDENEVAEVARRYSEALARYPPPR
jgi:diadenosine tetraphosphate (Ap4A) HIT family hydrolase